MELHSRVRVEVAAEVPFSYFPSTCSRVAYKISVLISAKLNYVSVDLLNP